ncbi:hypothetical protein DFJ74DRAFT_659631 [Hyaloraphidium curvatum]|nr:hypothetical protein DFJ74DRAFT_659631 [Hyaloraphidium curvatum]
MRSGIALLAAMAVVGTLQDIFFQFSAVVAVVLLGPVVVAATVLGYYIDPSRSKASPSPTQVPVPPDSSDLTCLICMDMPRDTLIRPCNHVVLCGACSADARLRSCPVCRGPVRSVEKVYT